MNTVPSVGYPRVYDIDENYEHNNLTGFADPTERETQHWLWFVSIDKWISWYLFSRPFTGSWIHSPNVCRFFLNGNCRYGNFCRNSHIIPSGETAPSEPIADTAHEDTNNNNNSYIETNETTRNWIDAPEFIPRYITRNAYDTDQPSNVDEGASRLVRFSSNRQLQATNLDKTETFILFVNSHTISYAQIVSGNPDDGDVFHGDTQTGPTTQYMEATLCPYIQSTITRADGSISCKYGDRCIYQHGDLCDICGTYCLHPTDQNQRKNHEKVKANTFNSKCETSENKRYAHIQSQ